MIIWSGLGFLVAVIVFGCSLALNLAFNAWLGEGYYSAHKWPVAISLFLSAILCWLVGSALRKRSPQAVIDKASGKEMVIDRGHHSLFFIPMHLWAPILAVIGDATAEPGGRRFRLASVAGGSPGVRPFRHAPPLPRGAFFRDIAHRPTTDCRICASSCAHTGTGRVRR